MTSYEPLKSFALSLGADVFENEPMSKHTTFKIGGPADIFVLPKNEEQLQKIYTFCAEAKIPIFILGNGSNLLVSDKGIRAAVIQSTGVRGVVCEGENLTCSAGEKLSVICEYARDEELSGLEFAYGIPGSVGGAVYMNAGAYGGEMKDVVAAASYIEGTQTGSINAEGMCFGYRHSVFSGTDKIITRVTFALHRNDRTEICEKMRELMERRKTKQPLEWPSAGSIFKRPPGNYAGTLIESCGLKGTLVGGAQVSVKHAGFIINVGNATCKDVLELIEKVQEVVLKQTGIALECEIRVAGEV
jgi:UDP-N-acetylmuramate dehydrogenase